MSKEGAARMGIPDASKSYGDKTDFVVGKLQGFSQEDFLRLAWACIDQGSTSRTVRAAERAMAAIEELFDAEPETLRTGGG